MTFAPPTIQATRQLKLTHLDMHPGTNSYPNDLDPNEVGIVGDTAHAAKGTSYHLGADQLADGAYSARTARDRAGLSNAASAEDVGQFKVTTGTGTFDLRHYTAWLFAQCRKSAPDTLDLREVIGTVDGKTVLRWDAERGRSSAPRTGEADSSHLWHTHKSWYRDSEFRPKTPLDERYLREIGVIGDDMELSDTVGVKAGAFDPRTGPAIGEGGVVQMPAETFNVASGIGMGERYAYLAYRHAAAASAKVDAISVPAPAPVDVATFKAVLLDPEVLAALAKAVNDDAAARLAE